MATLIMTKGLPASGKSTWAAEHVLGRKAGDVVRVTKDMLREMLHAGRHHGNTESQVVTTRDVIVAQFLGRGIDVIVDDTNLNPVHEERLRRLAAAHEAEFMVQDFTSVDVDECIRRDLGRMRTVGESVIREMHQQWLRVRPTPASVDALAEPAVIIDVDGTVARMVGRGPYDWDLVGSDEPNKPVIAVVRALHAAGNQVLFLSGRDSICRTETMAWLDRHIGVPYRLYMRPVGDNRKDSLVKRELFDEHVSGRYQVVAVLDDRDQVVRMWRDELGLTCLQVDYGAF